MNAAQSINVTICNTRGLHARASANFVKCAEKFNANVTVTCNGQSVTGTSIMGLLMLGASRGTEIEISAKGPEADEVLRELKSLIECRFNEEQ